MKSEIEKREYAAKQISRRAPESIIDILVIQLNRVEEANIRIEKEGIVVKDSKGSVIPHPAIEIEMKAQKMISDTVKRYRSIK